MSGEKRGGGEDSKRNLSSHMFPLRSASRGAKCGPKQASLLRDSDIEPLSSYTREAPRGGRVSSGLDLKPRLRVEEERAGRGGITALLSGRRRRRRRRGGGGERRRGGGEKSIIYSQ